jgi:hypothetical protein
MTTARLRLARWLVLAAVFVLVLEMGGSLYEHLVVDTAWVDNPRLVQSARGGIDRKLFWIPIHGALTLALMGAIIATWSERAARIRVWIGAGLYAAMRIWTFAYFVPFVAEVEALDVDVLSPSMVEASRTWIRLSMLRFPLVLGAAVACWLAYRRLPQLER